MRAFPIFGVTMHDIADDDFVRQLQSVRGLIVTPNPEILLAARANAGYRATLQGATLSLPDGIATIFALAALHDAQNVHRHTGVDAVAVLAEIASETGEMLVIVGGYASDHSAAQTSLLRSFPNLRIVCIDPGVISEDNPKLDPRDLEVIRNAGPSIVIVALGQGRGRVQGRQEKIANDIIAHAPNVRCAIGVGGAVDMLAGTIQRAPKTFQRFGVEWVWRFWQNPWRFPRMFRAVIVFPMCIAWDTLRQRRFFRACASVFRRLTSHFSLESV